MIYCLLLLLMLLASAVAGEETAYHVRAPRRQLNIYDHRDQILTHSDDGGSKNLPAFFLDIFETRGELSDDSLPVLRMAMNKFLLEELNAIYAPDNNEIESIGSAIIGKTSAIPPNNDNRKKRRLNNNKMGTEIMMEVEVTFDNEPSPKASELDEALRAVMNDLGYFVTNLTEFGFDEFKDVTEAYRREIPTDSPTSRPVDDKNVDNIEGGSDNSDNEVAREIEARKIAIPSALVAATLIAVLIFLIVRRRKRSNTDQTKSEDMMNSHLENGLPSFDQSLSTREEKFASNSMDSISGLGSSQSEDSLFSRDVQNKSLKMQKSRTSMTTVPTSNNDKRAYDLLNVLRNIDEEEKEPMSPELPGRPSLDVPPPADRQRYFGPVDLDTTIDSSVDDHLDEEEKKQEEQAPQSARYVLSDLANLATCRTPTNNVPSADPTPPVASPARKTPQEQKSGFFANAFQCTPTNTEEPATVSLTPNADTTGRFLANDKTPLVRNYSRDQQDDSYDRGSQLNVNTNAPSIFRPKTPENNRSRTSTPNRSGQNTPGQNNSRSTTPNRSRTTTPNRSRPSSRVTTPNRSQANTPNRSRKNSPNNNNENIGKGQWVGNTPESLMKVPARQPQQKTTTQSPGILSSALTCGAFGMPATNTVLSPSNDAEMTPPQPKGGIFIEGMHNEVFYPTSGRRHAGNNGVDGSAMYQATAMDPNEWSYKSCDNASLGNSTISEGALPRLAFNKKSSPQPTRTKPQNENNKSPGRQLINELNWIEKKIADVRKNPISSNVVVPKNPPPIDTVDSLSYASGDNNGIDESPRLRLSTSSDVHSSNVEDSVMSSIVCRDCYAPPGKLHIVIHSTKDGPAVHSVKQGSKLEGHIFAGDLIISVDNVDTRSFTAEHVMKMMASKNGQERKITVLHFEEESQI